MSKTLFYRKYLLNRVSVGKDVIDYLENLLARDEESLNHSFHKVMVHNWLEDDVQLYNTINEYYNVLFVPVEYASKQNISSFYTSSLSFVTKIVKMDFMFPYRRNMFNIDILFNDKSSSDCFESRITIEEIVSSVVSNRFNNKMELDLSNFCNDPEFAKRKINFYKIDLLANFKILMLRMGRDVKMLNLSNNQLNQVPLEILNFFTRGDMIGLNLSNNNIPSIQEQFRVGSKVEHLWLEGNPLCEELEVNDYIKKILIKFPRLLELDGVRINQHGIIYPFFKHFVISSQKKTKMVVEKFVTMYFNHYDSKPRSKINMFYDMNAVLTISTDFSDYEELAMPHYEKCVRNIMHPVKRARIENNKCIFKSRNSITKLFEQFPESTHDVNTFNVDVLKHDSGQMLLVIDGIYKEQNTVLEGIYKESYTGDAENKKNISENYLQFRRTFIFNIHTANGISLYHITNEMFTISLADRERKDNSFKFPIRKMNDLSLINPDKAEIKPISKAFKHLTMLKKSEVERRLKAYNWNINLALKKFIDDVRNDIISTEHIEEENSFSDVSSDFD
ncbi:PREDICTED: nuclear RNA export factor 1-like isoform X1 [Papilio xuthus]|uniref:Nuclear RNA export factor 1-like isoform X1 n=2 Tax=Papilio xuthus TaxID=66420 RepID=A0AAJ6Z6D8_PAPXU|nr:PREDICTED: nuclear RNA export factor 1-like isoform X1 [Papilio xuthus]